MKSALASICLLAGLAFVAPAAVISFEDLSGQAALPSNYAGLTWTSGWDYYDWAQPPYNPSSGVVRVYNNGGTPPPGFSFPAPVVFDGAYFAGNSNAQYQLYLSGGLVATSGLIGLSSTPAFLASGYAGLIDEVRLNVIQQGQFVMDDVTYNGANGQIPEPATIGLFGAGLVGLLLLRRR